MEGLEACSLCSQRVWLALAVLIFSYFITDLTEAALYRPIVHALGIHRSAQNTLGRNTYGTLMVVRLLWDGSVWLVLCKVLAQSPLSLPLCPKRLVRYTVIGLGTGLTVMLFAMLGIWAVRSATVGASGQSVPSAFGNGIGWLILDFSGALGEELGEGQACSLWRNDCLAGGGRC